MGSLRQLKGVLVRSLQPSDDTTPGRRRLGCFFTVHLIDATSGDLCEQPVYTSTLSTEASNPSWTDVDHTDMRVELAPPDKAAGWARGVFGIRVWSCEGTGTASDAPVSLSPSSADRGHAGTKSPAPRAVARRSLGGWSTRGTEESPSRATLCDAADCSRRGDHSSDLGAGIFGVVERGADANGLGGAGTHPHEDERHGERELETRIVTKPSGGDTHSSTCQRKERTTLSLEVIHAATSCEQFFCKGNQSSGARACACSGQPLSRDMWDGCQHADRKPREQMRVDPRTLVLVKTPIGQVRIRPTP